MNELDGVIEEFLVESFENLAQLDRDLVALEKNPSDQERLASIFRTIHTIKGTCGFFEFVRLGALTHAGENLLSQLRDGAQVLSPEITTELLRLVDAVRRTLAHIERTGKEDSADHGELIAALTRLQSGARATPAAPVSQPAETEEPLGTLAEGNIRVAVGLLDKVMNLVGELVLARNQILQYSAGKSDAAIIQASQRLNLITTELQEGVMKTRMQPIGNVWNKLPRVVRDLALACGKDVRISLEGRETELDKTILEAVKDPLTHLVRNAIDHGLETPAERRKAAKPEAGHVSLRAFHEGGQVNIEVSDDGRGMDPERIRRKALERGLVTQEQAARLGSRELLQLVFLPGFSTAEKVTNISGRGVGMDVVKTNIEKIGGTVDLQSRPGAGTTVKIKIPLTLAIIPALIVSSGGDRYAIPQVSLLELVRLEEGEVQRRIEHLYGSPVYRLRGNLLPVVYLNRVLGVEAVSPAGSGSVTLVVLQAGGQAFGLAVDGVHDTQEIVVKALAGQLKRMPLYAGATILGDGRVALILDVIGLAQLASVVSEVRERSVAADTGTVAERAEERQTLLVCGVSEVRRVAMRLSQVERLEVVLPSSVEWAAGQEVVQYRGGLLPLVRLDGAAHDGQEPLHVVVSSVCGRPVGLVVGRILDTVETAVAVQQSGCQPGLFGSAVVQQRVTDLIDLPALLHASRPDLFECGAIQGRA